MRTLKPAAYLRGALFGVIDIGIPPELRASHKLRRSACQEALCASHYPCAAADPMLVQFLVLSFRLDQD